MIKTIPFSDDLAGEYERLWNSAGIALGHVAEVDRVAKALIRDRARYEAVQRRTGVSWEVVAVIHNLEAGRDFRLGLHCGTRWDQVTKLVPKGRGPFASWEDAAFDALVTLKKLDQVKDWSIPRILYQLELYNGWGYRLYHPETLSPYLWSFTSHYVRGKYVADGHWDPNAVSKQIGAAALLKRIYALTGADAWTRDTLPATEPGGAVPSGQEDAPKPAPVALEGAGAKDAALGGTVATGTAAAVWQATGSIWLAIGALAVVAAVAGIVIWRRSK